MAKIVHFICCVLAPISPIFGAPQPSNSLVAPITQPNPSSPFFTITLNQKEKLILDIESPFPWHHCPKAFPRVPCHTAQCLAAHSYKPPFCHLQIPKPKTKPDPCTCFTLPSNPISKTCALSELSHTKVSIFFTDGSNPLPKTANYSKIYISCVPKPLFHQSLPNGSSGFASLSRGPLSLVSQFSTPNVAKKLGLCLADHGVAFFGEGPFNLRSTLPGGDVIQSLSWTPLLKHPYDPLGYYIGLKGISISLKSVMLLKSRVKLSTVTPYTTLRSNVYKAVVNQFGMLFKDVPRVPKVTPFDLCLNSTRLTSTRVGLLAPQIDLELSNGANWTIFGFNSLKQVGSEVACLALVDGGEKAEEAVVLGLHQMQHNFMQFDLVKSRLGFSGLLFFLQTNCNNFNFTSAVN